MSTQIVRNWMTPNPITVTPRTKLSEAHRLMLEYNIHCLPVVSADRVVGIITRRDICQAQSLDSTTLSVYELNSILDRLTVREFMACNPMTVSADATIGDAADLILKYKIGGLPVVEDGKLFGIITETDISVSILQPENAV